MEWVGVREKIGCVTPEKELDPDFSAVAFSQHLMLYLSFSQTARLIYFANSNEGGNLGKTYHTTMFQVSPPTKPANKKAGMQGQQMVQIWRDPKLWEKYAIICDETRTYAMFVWQRQWCGTWDSPIIFELMVIECNGAVWICNTWNTSTTRI